MTEQISRTQFCALLTNTIHAHPDWLTDAVLSLHAGMQSAVDDANRHACDMETLFVMSALHGRLPTKPRDREYLATILERWAPQSRFNFANAIKELRSKK